MKLRRNTITVLGVMLGTFLLLVPATSCSNLSRNMRTSMDEISDSEDDSSKSKKTSSPYSDRKNDWIIRENERVYNELIQNSTGISNGIKYDKANLLFFTDCHIDYVNPDESYQNSTIAFDFANNSPIPFDGVINGGDTITPFGNNSKKSEKEKFMSFFSQAKASRYPFIYCKGNHDLNDWNNTPANTFNDADWSEMFYDYAEERYGIVRQTKSNGNKSTWHYYDIVDKRIRVVCVDVQDTDKTKINSEGNVFYHGGVSWYISQEQMTWLIDVALNFDEKENKDWGVIIVSHQGKGYGDFTNEEPLYEDSITKFHSVLIAFNNHKKYSNSYLFPKNSFFDLTINADFSRYALEEDAPRIICWLQGHEHADNYLNQDGINVIWTSCSACYENDSSNLPRTKNSITQICFDILSIDTIKKEISLIRYGAGENRFLDEGLVY